MNIGTVARLTGIPAKTIRYYESIGLTPMPVRGKNGYRCYSDRDAEILRFVQRARSLGFSLQDVSQLLGLWRDRERSSADVKRLALEHIEDIERRIAELETMRATLRELTGRCHGDHRPDCPILERLAGGTKAAVDASGSVG